MIKFFRKIRQNLLTENKFSKYLLYAIGEIVLVVVGILIALSINNWNENKKMEIEESKYLIRIYSDLEKDSIYFSRRLRESKQEVENYYTFIHEAYKVQKSQEEFTDLVNLTWFGSEQLSVHNSTFLEMINAGKLDLISNDSLKFTINDLHRRYDAVGKHIQEFNQYTVGILTEWVKISPGTKYRDNKQHLFDEPYMFESSEWKWINNPRSQAFRMGEETIGAYTAKHKVFINYFNQLVDEITVLRNTIRDELDK